MIYGVLEKDGAVRDWVRNPNLEQKRFKTKELAERWIEIHGKTELQYEAVPASQGKQRPKRKPKPRWELAAKRKERCYDYQAF